MDERKGQESSDIHASRGIDVTVLFSLVMCVSPQNTHILYTEGLAKFQSGKRFH